MAKSNLTSSVKSRTSKIDSTKVMVKSKRKKIYSEIDKRKATVDDEIKSIVRKRRRSLGSEASFVLLRRKGTIRNSTTYKSSSSKINANRFRTKFVSTKMNLEIERKNSDVQSTTSTLRRNGKRKLKECVRSVKKLKQTRNKNMDQSNLETNSKSKKQTILESVVKSGSKNDIEQREINDKIQFKSSKTDLETELSFGNEKSSTTKTKQLSLKTDVEINNVSIEVNMKTKVSSENAKKTFRKTDVGTKSVAAPKKSKQTPPKSDIALTIISTEKEMKTKSNAKKNKKTPTTDVETAKEEMNFPTSIKKAKQTPPKSDAEVIAIDNAKEMNTETNYKQPTQTPPKFEIEKSIVSVKSEIKFKPTLKKTKQTPPKVELETFQNSKTTLHKKSKSASKKDACKKNTPNKKTPLKMSFDFTPYIDKIIEEVTLQQTKPETLLDKDFSDSSSDEEYKPNEEELNELDDTFQEEKSQTSERDLQEQFQIIEEDSTQHGDDKLVYRTRSKVSYMDTALEDIEQAFIPPDIDQDMYDSVIHDQDWKEFLTEFTKPIDKININEDDDTEFIPNLYEDEIIDSEELRRDPGVKVSKKELSELMSELFEINEIYDYEHEDVDVEDDEHINEYVNLKFNETFNESINITNNDLNKTNENFEAMSKSMMKNKENTNRNVEKKVKFKNNKETSNSNVHSDKSPDKESHGKEMKESDILGEIQTNEDTCRIDNKQIRNEPIDKNTKPVDSVEKNNGVQEGNASEDNKKIVKEIKPTSANRVMIKSSEVKEIFNAYIQAIEMYKRRYNVKEENEIYYHNSVIEYGKYIFENICDQMNQSENRLPLSQPFVRNRSETNTLTAQTTSKHIDQTKSNREVSISQNNLSSFSNASCIKSSVRLDENISNTENSKLTKCSKLLEAKATKNLNLTIESFNQISIKTESHDPSNSPYEQENGNSHATHQTENQISMSRQQPISNPTKLTETSDLKLCQAELRDKAFSIQNINSNITSPFESDAPNNKNSYQPISNTPKLFESEDLKVLRGQINQHIQYCLQHYLQTYNHPRFHNMSKQFKTMIEIFFKLSKRRIPTFNQPSRIEPFKLNNELKDHEKNVNQKDKLVNNSKQNLKKNKSYFQSLNINEAMNLINSWETMHSNNVFKTHMSKEWAKCIDNWKYFKKSLDLPLPIINTILHNKAFIYPLLLPNKSFNAKERSSSVPKLELNNELNLIIYGLINFSYLLKTKNNGNDSKNVMIDILSLIQRNYVPVHKLQYIVTKVYDLLKSNNENNVKQFLERGIVENIQHFVIDYNERNVVMPKQQHIQLLPSNWREFIT